MKTVDDAFFDPDGQHLIATTRGRFHYYAVDTTASEPTVEKLWDHKLTQVFWVAFGRDVVIASNTSDKHVAVSKKTGDVVWERPRPKCDGIRGHGIVVDHQGTESYVFTGYENVYQVSTETGEDICEPWSVDFWTSKLHDLGGDRLGVVVPAYVSADRDHYSMAELDLNEQRLEFRCDFAPNLLDPVPAPDGSRCAFRRAGPPKTIEVFDVPSGTSAATHTAAEPDILRAAWSPGGRWLGIATTTGFRVVDSTFERVVEVPYGRTFGSPAFHPDEEHILLPRDKTTAVESIEALFDRYAP